MKAIKKVKQLVLEQGCISEWDILKAYGEIENPLTNYNKKIVTTMTGKNGSYHYFNLLFDEKQFHEILDLIRELDLLFSFDGLGPISLNEKEGQFYLKRHYKKKNGLHSLIHPYDSMMNNCILVSKKYLDDLTNKKKNLLIKFCLFNKKIVQHIKNEGGSHE